ncbi:MAG: DUF1365 family protein [Gammaproteobacteria bacterium]
MYFNGKVFHKRVVDRTHQFNYLYPAELFTDIYCLDNKRFKDHLLKSFPRFIDTIHPGLEDLLLECKLIFSGNLEEIEIDLLALPNNSILNRFNPVRFFFIMHKNNCLGLIADVTNTFKEKRAYFVHNNGKIIDRTTLKTKKDMYVSPFNEKHGCYEFQCNYSRQSLKIDINQFFNNKIIVKTRLQGSFLLKRTLIQRLNLLFSGVLVIPRIHWQALVLFLKKHTIFPHGDSGYHNENT